MVLEEISASLLLLKHSGLNLFSYFPGTSRGTTYLRSEQFTFWSRMLQFKHRQRQLGITKEVGEAVGTGPLQLTFLLLLCDAHQFPVLCQPLVEVSQIVRGQGHLSSAAAAKSLQSCPTLCDPIDTLQLKNHTCYKG